MGQDCRQEKDLWAKTRTEVRESSVIQFTMNNSARLRVGYRWNERVREGSVLKGKKGQNGSLDRKAKAGGVTEGFHLDILIRFILEHDCFCSGWQSLLQQLTLHKKFGVLLVKFQEPIHPEKQLSSFSCLLLWDTKSQNLDLEGNLNVILPHRVISRLRQGMQLNSHIFVVVV